MLINDIHSAELNSLNQTIRARVEIHKGSTLEQICTCGDVLSDFTVERAGEGKFFGYGICQKLRVSLIDINRAINITKEHTIEVAFGVDGDFIYPFPVFYVEDVERDETSNLITVTCYDFLYRATNHTTSEIELSGSYTIETYAMACAAILGVPLKILNGVDSFRTVYPNGANFDGSETIRDALNAIAEATQTIYYLNSNWELTFKRLDKQPTIEKIITKAQYISFANEGAQVLGSIHHVTELGDNVVSSNAIEGVTQYVRDNPFWELREDIAALVDAAQAAAGGLSINQFTCEWIGNYLLEIGDKIALIAEDDSMVSTYILDDSITFDGTLSQITKWYYDKNDAETASNPSSLGEALNKTFARVDKVNKQIELVASESSANAQSISTLQVNTNSIAASVSAVESNVKDLTDSTSANFEKLSKEVSTKMSSEDVQIVVSTEMEKGATKVQTSTGFTFNEEGLTVRKSSSEIETVITEDGMKIRRNGSEVLTADNKGVKAEDLHATTYLIIGNNSRIEDFKGNRTACFWIGGK